MSINSLLYLGLLLIAVAINWVLPSTWRRAFVLLVSLGFYASWSPQFVWIPLAFAAIVYLIGNRIVRDTPRTKMWMRLGIALVLAFLVFFKYRGFLLANFTIPVIHNGALQSGWVTSIAFPMGISFYTFEAISCLIDVRQGRLKMPGFLDLCLFFLFWPNILSGPIVRAKELMPQLAFRKNFEARFVFEGYDRIIWGLVQKNAISNVLGIWVDKGFVKGLPAFPTTPDAWFLAIAFGLQIYFDFAGYTNIAIGAARLLGVTLPENFRYPYHAATPPEFWSRWHMTLSRWVRDYLFFPINAKWKGSPIPLYLSLLGVMALVGLWHGAGWNFVIWGLMHGTYLVLYRVYESYGSRSSDKRPSPIAATLWRVGTLLGVVSAWVVFRAATLGHARAILASMFYRFHLGLKFTPLAYGFCLVVALLCIAEPDLVREAGRIEESSDPHGAFFFRVVARPIAYLCGLLLFMLFETSNAQFIYSQF